MTDAITLKPAQGVRVREGKAYLYNPDWPKSVADQAESIREDTQACSQYLNQITQAKEETLTAINQMNTDLGNYYTKAEVDDKIGDIETILKEV